jgi:hypothetical protein
MTTPLRDCFGWPLPAPNRREKSKALAERIKSDFAQLNARALSGDADATKEFEHTLVLFGHMHQHLLRDRAKAGDKEFDGCSSIQELLWLADDTTTCLAWLAKNKSADCTYYAERRMNWPGFISILADVESKSQAIKACIPLGRRVFFSLNGSS